MRVVLKEDWVIPAGEVMVVCAGLGPIEEYRAVTRSKVGMPSESFSIGMDYVLNNQEKFQIQVQEGDPSVESILASYAS